MALTKADLASIQELINQELKPIKKSIADLDKKIEVISGDVKKTDENGAENSSSARV